MTSTKPVYCQFCKDELEKVDLYPGWGTPPLWRHRPSGIVICPTRYASPDHVRYSRENDGEEL